MKSAMKSFVGRTPVFASDGMREIQKMRPQTRRRSSPSVVPSASSSMVWSSSRSKMPFWIVAPLLAVDEVGRHRVAERQLGYLLRCLDADPQL